MPDADFSNWFFTQGVLGVMALLSIIVNIALWRAYQAALNKTTDTQDARLEDQKEDRSARFEVDRRIATTLELINEKIKSGRGQ